MGVRSTGRKLAMQIMYQTDLRKTSIDTILESFFQDTPYQEETKLWAITLAKETENHRTESDELIQKYAIEWDLDRINPIDLNILRIAFYELRHTDTPINIVLNEAIEISKKYSNEDSSKFINGILGNYVKECSQES